MARRNRPPDRLPLQIRDHVEVVRACREWNVGRLFRVVNNLSEEPTKFTVTHIGRLCGLSVTRVSEYMNDAHRVTAVGIIERISDGLRIPGERFGLVSRPWENEAATTVLARNVPAMEEPSKSRQVMGTGVLPAAGQRPPTGHDQWRNVPEWHDPRVGGPASATHPREEDDVERREMLGLVGGAVAGGLLSTAEPLRRRVDAALNVPTNAYDADEWERAADQYAHLVPDARHPTPDVLPQLLADLDEARLRTESAGDDTRPRMVRACALLSALAAVSLVKIGHHFEAGRYWRTAQRAAHMFGDRQLHALVRGTRAGYALHGDANLGAVLRLADDAIEIAGDTASSGAVRAHGARAVALARLGSSSEARAALADVETVFARLPDSVLSDRESQWGWPEHRLRYVQSAVHSYSGRVPDAAEAQDTALSLYPASFRTAPAQVQLHRAFCMVASRDPSEAARHTIRTLEALPSYLRHEALIRHPASLVFDAMPAPALKLPVVKQAREMLALPSDGVT